MIQNNSFFKISSIDKHIVYIHGNLFKKMTNLTNHVKNMHYNSCGTNISLCQQYKCNSTMVIYIDVNIAEITPKNIEYKYYKNVNSFLTIELYKNQGEIYNACTDKSARKRGIMKSILKSVLVDIPKDKIWLGIDLNNKLLYVILHLYLSVGFIPDGIQNISPSGNYPGFPFISLTYDKSINNVRSVSEIKTVEQQSKTIIRQYIQNNGKCHMNIYIESVLMNTIYDTYIQKDVELGGIMGVQDMGNNNYMLGLAAITKGSKKNFTVDIPNYYITWHTHPFICYTSSLCYIGWPSGMDMSRIINNYTHGDILHILFAYEGTYILQLSPQMMNFMRAMESECINFISELITYYFGDLENFRNIKYDADRIKCLDKTSDIRCLTYDTKQKHISIGNILTIINTFTLTSLLNLKSYNNKIILLLNKTKKCLIKTGKLIKGNSDIPIFKVQYTDRETSIKNGINAKLEFIIAPNESTCPIPEYTKSDIDFGIQKDFENFGIQKMDLD